MATTTISTVEPRFTQYGACNITYSTEPTAAAKVAEKAKEVAQSAVSKVTHAASNVLDRILGRTVKPDSEY